MFTAIISFLVVLGILIFIHELGHFMVAKAAGVGVEVFSLGFGPKILWFRRGETLYQISAVPFGGYVKMTGESPEESAEDAAKGGAEQAKLSQYEIEQKEEEWREKSFTHKPLRSRVAIVAAGSLMNLALALMLYPFIHMIGISVPAFMDERPIVGFIAPDEAADKAGLRHGDNILSVNGDEMKNFEEFLIIVALSPEKELKLKVERDGTIIEATLTPESSKLGAGISGFYPPNKPLIDKISPGGAAEGAGLKEGDLITKVDGKTITHFIELQQNIHASGEERAITVLRGGQELTLKVTPRLNKEMDVYLIGVSPVETVVTKRYGFFKSIELGLKMAWDKTVLLGVVIKKLFAGDLSIKTLGGPIMIAQVSGQVAQSGLVSFLTFLAFLSLQLGIINLLPIPVLDGGHLFFYAIEYVRKGKPLSDYAIGMAQQVGMALLLTLMVVVTWNDLKRINIIGFISEKFGALFG
jgi:regulator of sigma E protease